jgi:Arc/MetJ family transcription regulator
VGIATSLSLADAHGTLKTEAAIALPGMGRTNIVLDDALIKQAMRVSGAKTKREAVDRALREMVARQAVYRALRKLRGELPWDGDVATWRRRRR